MSKYCAMCGKESTDYANYCWNCGAYIKTIAENDVKSTLCAPKDLKCILLGKGRKLKLTDSAIVFFSGAAPDENCREIKLSDIVKIRMKEYRPDKNEKGIATICEPDGKGSTVLSPEEALNDDNSFELLSKKANDFFIRLGAFLENHSEVFKGIDKYPKELKKEEQARLAEEEKLKKAAELELNSTARCPLCGSTSLSYSTKKLSIGRAIVGGAIAGETGAILGGLSGKQGYLVCMNCGHKWKI